MPDASVIDEYAAGAKLLRQAVAGMSEADFDARPIPGKWSTRQVVCHLADFEPIYADRMKRVIAEERPTLFGGDPDVFAAALAYGNRPVAVELDLIAAVREQMVTILRKLPASAWQRIGNHSEAGPLTLETLLRRVTEHLPHHVRFIEEKRATLAHLA
jgi:uncharacterized damage-inducible protein DinB